MSDLCPECQKKDQEILLLQQRIADLHKRLDQKERSESAAYWDSLDRARWGPYPDPRG